MQKAHLLFGALILVVLVSLVAFADTIEAQSSSTRDLPSIVLIGIPIMLVLAKLGGEISERLNQPAVLGELITGIILGNLVLLGFRAVEPLKTDAIIAALAEIGVILLLFEV